MMAPSLAQALRPQAAYRWLLPYLSAITPTYVESVLRGALAGNHVQAWELFDLMVDTDPEIAACVAEYCDAVLAKKFVFEPYHEEDEEPSDMAMEKHRVVSAALFGMRPDPSSDENALRETCRDLLFARFHGQSVLEVDWRDTYGDGGMFVRDVGTVGQVACPRSTYWVHPVCYAWGVEGRLGLRIALDNQIKALTDGAQEAKLLTGNQRQVPLNLGFAEPPAWNWITSQPMPSMLQSFPLDKFLIAVWKAKAGTALGGSVLRPLAWWWVASNFCGDWLLNYAQLFGIPFRKAKYSTATSEPQKQEILQMLQSAGSSGYIMMHESADVEFMKAGDSAGSSPQAFLFNFADSQKRKVILHQTMTGGSHDSMGKGGGKAFGAVEQDTKAQCAEAGARFLEQVINLQLVPAILRVNYGPDGDSEAPTVRLQDSEVGGIEDAQRDQVLTTLIDVPASFLHRKYGVPKPKAGEEVAAQDVGTVAAQAQAQAQQQKDQMSHQQEMAKQRTAQIQAGGGQDGDENNDGVEARASRSPLQASEAATQALSESVEPLLARLRAIDEVKDPETKKALLRKLLKDWPAVTAALAHDDSLAKAITPDLVQKVVAGMGKPVEARKAKPGKDLKR